MNLSPQQIAELSASMPAGIDPMQFMLDDVDVAINYCRADMVLTYANKRHAALHGLTPDQVIGKKIIEIIGEDADKLVRPYYEKALRGEHVVYEVEANFLVGVRYIQCIYRPVFDADKKVLGWLTVIIDMTERRKLEKKLQKNEEMLRLAKEKAEAANIAKSEFLANMSHELRTPMNAIIGLVDILLKKDYPAHKQKEYLGVMQTSAHHLLALINDVLDVSKLEAEQELHIAAFNLDEVLKDVLVTQDMLAKQKNIELLLEEKGVSAKSFLGDALRLRQILLNLLSNAIKFTQHGYVKIIVEYSNMGADTPTQDIKISVTDTGIGIAENNMESIFNKFTQADSSISRIYGGTGLGLFICKELIEAMNGTLDAESQLGEGSKFIIQLSLPIYSDKQTKKSASQKNIIHLPKQKSHILLVEDNAGNILVTSSFLENYGYTYEIARNGQEALDILAKKSFDIILMDVQMPELDGFTATRIIRQRERDANSSRTPIIGLTAHALQGDKERCLEAGMDDYLAKPFNPDALAEVLGRLNQPVAYSA